MEQQELNVIAAVLSQGSARQLLASCSAEWGVCGGLKSSAGSSDNPLLCCSSGFGCARNSANYWQCLPGAPAVAVYVAPTSPPPSPPPSPPSSPPAPSSPSPPPPPPVATTAGRSLSHQTKPFSWATAYIHPGSLMTLTPCYCFSHVSLPILSVSLPILSIKRPLTGKLKPCIMHVFIHFVF